MQNQGERDEVLFPNRGGSWYHATKGFDTQNMRLAHQQFDIPISDVRAAIIYGTETTETREDDRLKSASTSTTTSGQSTTAFAPKPSRATP